MSTGTTIADVLFERPSSWMKWAVNETSRQIISIAVARPGKEIGPFSQGACIEDE